MILFVCLLLTGCGQMSQTVGVTVVTRQPSAPAQAPALEEEPAPEAKPIAYGGVSPNGRYQLLMMEDSDSSSDEIYHSQSLAIWDSEEHLIKWWDDMGSLIPPTAVWSHDGTYVAVSQGGRTYARVTVVDTESWTDWEVTLPDGGAIPEYVFLPDEWGSWTEPNVLRLLVGRGGDAGEQTVYRCTMEMQDGALVGITEPAAVTLAEGYDFNQNGVKETLTLEGNAGEDSSFWVLHIMEDNQEIWSDCAAISHAGWNSIFACKLDGEDYLIRYHPTMYQGFATYQYELFIISETGEELVLMQNQVEFDINFGSSLHQSFDAVGIAEFLWELHGYLADSVLLLSTEDLTFQSGIPGYQLVYYPFGCSYEDLMSLDSREAMEDAILCYEREEKEAQGIV